MASQDERLRRALIHRGSHLNNVLNNTKTSSLHDLNVLISTFRNLERFDVDDIASCFSPLPDSPEQTQARKNYELILRCCMRAEAFLYRVATGYERNGKDILTGEVLANELPAAPPEVE